MSKYEKGDKVVMEITGVSKYGECYEVAHTSMWNTIRTERVTEPLSTYTEPLEDKIKKLMEENLWLIAENTKLKAKDDVLKTSCDDYEEKVNDMCDTARAEGQDEAWELARKIILPPSKGGMSSDDYVATFGSCISETYVMKNYTYAEAAAKVAEWEEGKDEIKVGDIVKHNETEYTGIVTCVSERMDKITIIFKDGSSESYDSSMFHKTGRHIDIDRFLNQIGGEQE